MKVTLQALPFLLCFLTLFYCKEPSCAKQVEYLPACSSNKCLINPDSAVISNDGSFFLITDSSTKPYIRKVNLNGNTFTTNSIIHLHDNPGALPLTTGVSKNTFKAFVLRSKNTNSDGSSQVQILNLLTGNVKTLDSVKDNKLKINVVSFLDPEGKKLLAGTNNGTSSRLLIIDTETDQIDKDDFQLLDSPSGLDVSPDFKNAIISYGGFFPESLSLFDIEAKKLYRFDTPYELFFNIDDFILRGKYNHNGEIAVISSFGGKHALHLLDLRKRRLIVRLLSNQMEGSSFSDVTCDGKFAITAANIEDGTRKFKLYKTDLSELTKPTISSTKLVDDGSSVVDVDILHNSSEILTLVLKDGKTFVKIFDLASLEELNEFVVSESETNSILEVDKLGNYAVLPDSRPSSDETISSVTVIVNDVGYSPVIESIYPQQAPTTGGTAFTIKGFIDPTKFDLRSTRVCFKNQDFCATSVSISSDGRIITGITPPFPQATQEKVILAANPLPVCSDCSSQATTCNEVFHFEILKDAPPLVQITSPENLSFLNTLAVKVSVNIKDDRGIAEVYINNKKIDLAPEVLGKTEFNIFTELVFPSEGKQTIIVKVIDKAGNVSESLVQIIVDTKLGPVADYTDREDNQCKAIRLQESIPDINSTLVSFLGASSCEGASEVVNLPHITGGQKSTTLTPDENSSRLLDLPLNIRRGCSYATVISPDSANFTPSKDQLDSVFSVILTDSLGRNYLSGLAYPWKDPNTDDKTLKFVTIIRVPLSASEGNNAKISILSRNEVIALTHITIPPYLDLKAGKGKLNVIKNPVLKNTLKVALKKLKSQNPELVLKVEAIKQRENSLLTKKVIINGIEYRKLDAGDYFTQVSFVPPDGILPRKMRFTEGRKKFYLKSIIDKSKIPDLQIRLANIKTPQCADIIGFQFPTNLSPKKEKLLATVRPEALIIARFGQEVLRRGKSHLGETYADNATGLDSTYVIDGLVQKE